MNSSKKAQMKIQQMAFMLVAIMIFFGMVAIIYFTIVVAKLQGTVDDLREQEAKELARQMAGTPELMFSKTGFSESSAVDFDKALALKEQDVYKTKYWNLDFLMIERLYPPPDPTQEWCNINNRETCQKLLLIGNIPSNSGGPDGTQTSPIVLVRWDSNLQTFKYELGRIHALAHDSTK
ncbi:MAG: hypothetical protein KKD18_02475 [Nanoarchaeota archaeon]|nr:hypothetical protein [Nanoarchaeota archaeon]MBU0977256.1 hypothetical protein [Nanoarchaeota archaeon]